MSSLPSILSLGIAVSALLVSSMTSGCRAKALPDAGFLDQPQLLQADKKIPFNAAWIKEDADLLSYKKVYVAPVDTTHLLKLDWWQSTSLEPGDQKQWADELANDFRDKMKAQFADDDPNKYQVVDSPDDETLIIELAIVEVVPTKTWLNAIGYVVAGALDQGETGFEGRLRDGKTKRVIAEFKDHEYGQFDIVSVRDLEWAGHSRHTLQGWSEELEEICYRQPDEVVSPMSPVTLMPW
ncbi:MAG: hypothetical protein RL518_1546 [Pseudomonadota bacterium]|jgi:hypothetical protein